MISANCLKNPQFTSAVEYALSKEVKIILLHDHQSCLFPSEAEQPHQLMLAGVFKDKAVTFMEQYSHWQEIQKLSQKLRLFGIERNIPPGATSAESFCKLQGLNLGAYGPDLAKVERCRSPSQVNSSPMNPWQVKTSLVG